MTDIKFCGLRTLEDVSMAQRLGARWAGFVHFGPSPRDIDVSVARELVSSSGDLETVAVTVDPDDTLARQVSEAGYDWLQLHGSETPARLAELKRALGIKVMKALPVAEAEDLARASDYDGIADMILFDAKPPKHADRPGGWGEGYDYGLLKTLNISTPWLLSGGLTADNVRAAIAASGAAAVDVSSGIESQPGVKSPEKMEAFAKAMSS